MLCWGWFDNIKMADWMFIAGERTIRLNQVPVPGGRFQRWQAEMAEAGAFQRVADCPRQSRPSALPAWRESGSVVSSASSVHSCSWQHSPSAWWSSCLLPSCVCVHGANLRPRLVHVWLILSDTPDGLAELWGFILRWSFRQELLSNWQHCPYDFVNTEKKIILNMRYFKYCFSQLACAEWCNYFFYLFSKS